MLSNRYYLLKTKRVGAFGLGSLLLFATLGNLVADNPAPGVGDASGDSPAVPANSPVTVNPPAASGGSQAPDSTGAPDTSQTPDSTQAPVNSQTLTHSPGLNSPFLPQQGLNLNSPNASTTTNPQSPQLTAPTLYTTGTNNLSVISTNAGLADAFGGQQAFGSTTGPDDDLGPLERLRLGPFDLKAALLTSVVADDNLRAGVDTGGKVGDTSIGFTPAILLEYGNHDGQKGNASLVYAPTITRFFHQTGQNSDDQNVAFNAQYPLQRLTLSLAESYTQTTGVNLDTNTRTTQTSNFSSIGGNYDIDDKISVASSVQYIISTYSAPGGGGSGQTGEQDASLNNTLTYRLSEKISLGPSFNVGQNDPDQGARETFEQALMGLTYVPTEKIIFFAQGGAEFDQYSHEGDDTNPVFSIGAGYTPFESTSLSLNAYQNVHSSSADYNETIRSTGVGVVATQRFLHRYTLSFAFNYNHNDYQTTGSGTAGSSAAAGNNQDTLVYRPSLSFGPTSWSQVSIYYQYLANESDTSGFGYNDNQVGVSFSAQF
jgi:hypothetical protein